jgi:two-component system NtrC family response regulator
MDQLLAEFKAIDPPSRVIILTAFGTVETAVEAMKRGAADYLTKPISRDELLMTVAKTLKMSRPRARERIAARHASTTASALPRL